MTNENQTSVNLLEIRIKRETEIREILEQYTTNGLAKPVYGVETITMPQEPQSDDTLSRLEALMRPPEKKIRKHFLGAFFPLGVEENCDWLFVSPDGTVIRIKPPTDPTLSGIFKKEFVGKNELMVTITPLKESLQLEDITASRYAEIVYRNDQPVDDPEALNAQIRNDFELALKISIERAKRIQDQKERAQTSFLDIFNSQNRQQ